MNYSFIKKGITLKLRPMKTKRKKLTTLIIFDVSIIVNKYCIILFFLTIGAALSSCNKDDEIIEEEPPLPPGIIINVPADFPTIKMATDSAGINDTIVVTAGTYYEHDILLKAGTHLTSSSNFDNVIIDATSDGRCMRFTGSKYESSITGFTFKGGLKASGEFPDNVGAGLYAEGHASLTILNCKFYENIAEEGGGLFIRDKTTEREINITLNYCHFESNEGTQLVIVSCDPIIKGCQFIDGDCGLATYTCPTTTVQNCLFRNNSRGAEVSGGSSFFDSCIWEDNSLYGGHGGGLYVRGGLTLENCYFVNNYASYGAGGVYYTSSNNFGSIIMKECLFENNATNGSTLPVEGGGAIVITSSANNSLVENCTFFNNNSATGYGGSLCILLGNIQIDNSIISHGEMGKSIYLADEATLTINCTDIWGNIDGDWVDDFESLENQNGNFSLDPQYSNSSLNIEPSSPCATNNNSCDILIGARPVQK